MTDREAICTHMEPRRPWDGQWWKLRGPWDDVATEENSRHVAILDICLPLELLGHLWLVEEALTDAQWERYEAQMVGVHRHPVVRSLLHATAEQKIKALAEVLRPEAEPK